MCVYGAIGYCMAAIVSGAAGSRGMVFGSGGVVHLRVCPLVD
jgi:hypothetical protein